MRNITDIEWLRSQYRNRFRLLFIGLGWLLYSIARVFYFVKMRYNRHTHQMDRIQYHPVVSKLVMGAKGFVLLKDIWIYFVLFATMWIYKFLAEASGGQDFIMGLLIQLSIIVVLRRLILFLHSEADRRVIQHLVNEIFYIAGTMQRKFDMVYHCDPTLLGFYAFKLITFFIWMDALWYKPYFLMINFLHWTLLEYCMLAYFAYQLIVLNWYRNLILFLERFIEHHRTSNRIKGHYHRRLLWLFKLHLHIYNLHKSVNKSLGWLPTAIYLTIFTCIFNMTLMLECVIFAEDEIVNKIYIMADGCLGPVFVPIINVLIMGMCTDFLRSAELLLQQQVVIVNLQYVRKTPPHDLSMTVLYNELNLCIVRQKVEPLENITVFGITSDREFAFDFIITVIVTALSFIQYTISTDNLVKECATHK